jgi:Uma2 family endonuclease
VRLKLSSEAQPLPDVVGFSRIQTPYPTKPFEIAIEILSPPDPAQYLFRKCRLYAQWGIQHIVVLDPEDRTAQQWNRARQSLEPISEIAIEGRTPISVSRIWEELDRDLAQASQALSRGLNRHARFLERLRDQRARLFLQTAQMLFANEAFGVDFVHVFGS